MPDKNTDYADTVSALDSYRAKLLAQDPERLQNRSDPEKKIVNKYSDATASRDIIPKAAQIARLSGLAQKTGQRLAGVNDQIQGHLEGEHPEDDAKLSQLLHEAATHHQTLKYLAGVGKEIAGSNDPKFWPIPVESLVNPYASFKASPANTNAALMDYMAPEREKARR